MRLGLDVMKDGRRRGGAEFFRRLEERCRVCRAASPRDVCETGKNFGHDSVDEKFLRSWPMNPRGTKVILSALRGLAEAVNVKVLKAGGLDAARRWISLARSLGMRVMVGVMVETGIGRSAAAQLAPLADWLDIDPPDDIPAAPMIGFRVDGDRLMLSDRPGLGLSQVPCRPRKGSQELRRGFQACETTGVVPAVSTT